MPRNLNGVRILGPTKDKLRLIYRYFSPSMKSSESIFDEFACVNIKVAVLLLFCEWWIKSHKLFLLEVNMCIWKIGQISYFNIHCYYAQYIKNSWLKIVNELKCLEKSHIALIRYSCMLHLKHQKPIVIHSFHEIPTLHTHCTWLISTIRAYIIIYTYTPQYTMT